MFSLLTFPFDIIILSVLAFGCGISVAARVWLRKNPRRRLAARLGVRAVGWTCFLGVLLSMYGSFIEPRIITVTTADIPFPLEHPVKIVVISDLHVGPYKGRTFVERLVSRTNALLPDIIVLDGDFVLSSEVTNAELTALAPLKNLRPTVGTFAVLGNQDHGISRSLLPKKRPSSDRADLVMETLQSFGITVLKNTNTTVNLGTETLTITGIDDPWAGKADIVGAFDGIAPGTPTILLAHNPDVVLDPLASQAQLIVSGHTHGGQIRLPWYGALSTLPIHIPQRFDQGIFTLQSGSTLAITRGVGESGPRVRLSAPPEVMMLTLGTER
ncbi:MAG: metallophosphoesterase [Candidatus Peribacteraceae bacterium]|nr:metallophosphoesterase [Candidatus Peribacteraceae bacterium]